VRLDDPVKLVRYEAVNGALGAGDPTYFRPIERWDSLWLDELGVRWVVAPAGDASPQPSWILRYRGADAFVYERPTALPVVHWEEGGAANAATIEVRAPGHWRVRVTTATPRRLVVGEIWQRGWRARWNGRPLAIALHRDALMALALPAGSGTLELRYLPPGIVAGAWCSALALLLTASGALRERAAA